ncbi:MAG TPA: amidohydrolase family protein [Thermoanaerobaculia bacterium]|nr:amidohydrolase family protein [Thermoanaerobaculia bacterium]
MKLRAIPVVLLAFACSQTPQPKSAPAEAARRYDYFLGAGGQGTQVVTVNGHDRHVHFEYNDRGRGPNLDSDIELDDRSVPLTLAAKGKDYFKNNISESFANGTWRSESENGHSDDRNAIYVSFNSTPEEQGIIAKALLASPKHTLPLLPAGEASIHRLGDATVNSQHVTCYTITGLDFTPTPVWLDDHNELFASVSPWASLIREGAGRESAQQLIEKQRGWIDADAIARAAQLTHHPKGNAIVITNARLFDPHTLTTTPNTTIVIRGNRIESVGEGDIADAEHIDAHGRTVLPGLWDMHVHTSDEEGMLLIASGITSARDLGNDVDAIVATRKKFDDNTLVGPRLVLAALIDGTSPFTGPTKLIVNSEDDFRKVLDRVAPLGFAQTKIYSSIKPELVPFIARESHARGLRVSGHIPSGMFADDAVRAGYDEIQHANFLFLNFMRDVTETRNPQRFIAVAQRGADLDLDSPEVRSFVALLKEHKTVSDPTLAVFENMFTARKGTVSPTYAAIADRLPAQVRRGFLGGGLPVPEGMDQRYRDAHAKMLAFVKLLHDNGITIVAGTDALAGFTLHRELELYVKAGIPAPEVLRIATLGAATVMHRDDRAGSVEKGKLADLILVDGDPTTNISDIRKITTVIKDGLVFDVAELDREIGVKP